MQRRFRLIALVAACLVVSSHLAQCQGWLATPEARMACCADESQCPMHRGTHHDSRTRAVSQADADACCAARPQSNDSLPSSIHAAPVDVLALMPAPLAESFAPAIVRFVPPIETEPSPPIGRSRQILLSVFLI
jgi:hypothetical protein